MTNSIEDVCGQAQVILLVGSNPEEAHPVMGMRIRRAVERGAKLIVVDPRDIGLASKADIHLKLRPGTNVAFANGMAHVIIAQGLADKEFIEKSYRGLRECEHGCRLYAEKVAEICGIDADDLVQAATMYAKADRAPIIYCLGVAEHSTGTEGVMSMSNIAMVCGKFGKPGCGVNPLRGQNNVQGACDMGAGPADFTGYQKVANPDALAKFETAWGVKMNRTPGLMATECFPAMIDGRIKALFLFGEDPVRTDPDTRHVIQVPSKPLDFLVVDELFMTETATVRRSDFCPGAATPRRKAPSPTPSAACSACARPWRVRRRRRCLDTDVFAEIMRRMGYDQPLAFQRGADHGRDRKRSPRRTAGISHARLDGAQVAGRGLQWPCPNTEDHPGAAITPCWDSFSRGNGALFDSLEYRRGRPSSPTRDYPLMPDDRARARSVQRLRHDGASTEGHQLRWRRESFIELDEAVDASAARRSRRRSACACRAAAGRSRDDGARVGQDESPGRNVDAVPLPRRQFQLAHECCARPHREGA